MHRRIRAKREVSSGFEGREKLETHRGFSQSELMAMTLAVRVSAELCEERRNGRVQRMSNSRGGAWRRSGRSQVGEVGQEGLRRCRRLVAVVDTL